MSAYPPNPTNPPDVTTTTSTTLPADVPAGTLPDTGGSVDPFAALLIAAATVTVGAATVVASMRRNRTR